MPPVKKVKKNKKIFQKVFTYINYYDIIIYEKRYIKLFKKYHNKKVKYFLKKYLHI